MKGELFSTDMVQAFLDGRKSRTSRPVKGYAAEHLELDTDGSVIGIYDQTEGHVRPATDYAKYKPGDVMYVRETFYQYGEWYDTEKRVQINGEWEAVAKHTFVAKQGFPVYFKNTLPGNIEVKHTYKDGLGYYKRPSLFMPFEVARLFFRVTNVKAQNIADMTEQDAEQDGFQVTTYPNYEEQIEEAIASAKENFEDFWVNQYGSDARWMWVYYLKQISKEEALNAEK